MGMRNGTYSCNLQVFSTLELFNEEFMGKLLSRRWTLPSPETKVHQVIQRDQSHDCSVFLHINPSINDDLREKDKEDRYFYIVRDDLLDPLINGNKARKLYAVLPLLEDCSITDVVTCGGCQSAHTADVAALCAKRVIKSHLLLRGEQPEILAGYNLMSTIYGVIGSVQYLSKNHLFGRRALRFVVDAGTGTTATGLGLAALCLGLPWEIYAVMLAGTLDVYREKEERLISEFKKHFNVQFIDHRVNKEGARVVHWVERSRPRQ